MLRTISHSTGTRTKTFCNAVRARDQRCVLTGREPMRPARGLWYPLQAAHIFPLAYLDLWKSNNFERWVAESSDEGEESINSVRNGLLLDSGVHSLFDCYFISINPKVHT